MKTYKGGALGPLNIYHIDNISNKFRGEKRNTNHGGKTISAEFLSTA
jgi:hypothetical protein